MEKDGLNLGVILLVFISVIVGVIFFQSIAQSAGSLTNTVSVANESLGVVENNSVLYVTNYRALSDVVIYNDTNSEVEDTEYTVTNNVIYNGALSTQITVDADDGDGQTGYTWYISGTGQPLTYVADSGGRAMVSLVVIFFALAIGLVALYPVLSSKLLDMMGK